MVKNAIFLTLALTLIMPFWAYAAGDSMPISGVSSSFSEWVNTEREDKPVSEEEEKIVLREQWERRLGVDIFYPYFKAREIESKVSKKGSIKVLNISGKPEIKSNEAKYIFRIKF